MTMIIPATKLSSFDMERIYVKDPNGLKEVLENIDLMEKVYRFFVRGKITYAKTRSYPHPNGVKIKGRTGRHWLYVEIRNSEDLGYDVALWKILKVASQYPSLLEKLMKYIEVM